MLRCRSCGNTETFIGEIDISHWAKLDGEGIVIQLDHAQGEDDAGLGLFHNGAYLECEECNSEDVEDTEAPGV